MITLTAKEGVFLTNGETYGKTVALPANADTSVWHEITYEEVERLYEIKVTENIDHI